MQIFSHLFSSAIFSLQKDPQLLHVSLQVVLLPQVHPKPQLVHVMEQCLVEVCKRETLSPSSELLLGCSERFPRRTGTTRATS